MGIQMGAVQPRKHRTVHGAFPAVAVADQPAVARLAADTLLIAGTVLTATGAQS